MPKNVKPEFFFVNVDDLILPNQKFLMLNNDVLKAINKKSLELKIPIRFFINPENHKNPCAQLRNIYREAEKHHDVCIKKGNLLLYNYTDEMLFPYTDIKKYFDSLINEGKIYIISSSNISKGKFDISEELSKSENDFKNSIFKKALDIINKNKNTMEEVNAIAKHIMESLILKEALKKINFEQASGTIGFNMISLWSGEPLLQQNSVSNDERALIKILMPALDPNPDKRPSIEAIEIQLAKEILMKKNLPDFDKENAEIVICNSEKNICDRILKDIANLSKKYEEKRYANPSSLYTRAKNIGTRLRGRGGQERKDQVKIITDCVSDFKGNLSAEENRRKLYHILNNIEKQIEKKSIFDSVLQMLCQHYKRELLTIQPDLANPKNAESSSSRPPKH